MSHLLKAASFVATAAFAVPAGAQSAADLNIQQLNQLNGGIAAPQAYPQAVNPATGYAQAAVPAPMSYAQPGAPGAVRAYPAPAYGYPYYNPYAYAYAYPSPYYGYPYPYPDYGYGYGWPYYWPVGVSLGWGWGGHWGGWGGHGGGGWHGGGWHGGGGGHGGGGHDGGHR
jgi:hypothetical protein